MTREEIILKVKDSAFPQTINHPDGPICGTGLTKREYFAAMAMQGILANPKSKYIPTDAARLADWVLNAINKSNH